MLIFMLCNELSKNMHVSLSKRVSKISVSWIIVLYIFPWVFFFFFLRFHQTNCLKQCRFPFQVQRKVLEDEMRSLGVDMDDKDNVSVDGRGWGGALSWEPG